MVRSDYINDTNRIAPWQRSFRTHDVLRNPYRAREPISLRSLPAPKTGWAGALPKLAEDRGIFNLKRSLSAQAWSPRSMAGRLGNVGSGLMWEPLNIAVGIASVVGGTVKKSAEWGTASGLSEDYAAGAIYGFQSNIGQATGNFVGGAIGGLLGALTPFPVLGPAIGGFVGSYILGSIGEVTTQKWAYANAKMYSRLIGGELDKRRIRFGVPFRDTEQAYTMRQQAVQEMAGSLLNARQYLANEASFFHR